jgi:hypothetical protein
LTAIILIAFVIGGNTTVFSMVHGILTKPARGVRATRLVTLESRVAGRVSEPAHSYPDYVDYASSSTTVRSLLGFVFERFTLTLPGASYAVHGGLITNNDITLGTAVTFAAGVLFTDRQAGSTPGLVAIHQLRIWQEQFHGSGEVIGQAVMLNGHPPP